MLDQRAGLTGVVEAGLQDGQWIQSMLGAEGEGVLVGGEAVGQL